MGRLGPSLIKREKKFLPPSIGKEKSTGPLGVKRHLLLNEYFDAVNVLSTYTVLCLEFFLLEFFSIIFYFLFKKHRLVNI